MNGAASKKIEREKEGREESTIFLFPSGNFLEINQANRIARCLSSRAPRGSFFDMPIQLHASRLNIIYVPTSWRDAAT